MMHVEHATAHRPRSRSNARASGRRVVAALVTASTLWPAATWAQTPPPTPPAHDDAASVPPAGREPLWRDMFNLVFTLGTLANPQRVLDTELRKNGFSEAGMARPVAGWGIALSVWRCRLALELAETRVWSTVVRRASDGAQAEVWPTLDSLDFGYEAYVGRFLSIVPIVGLAWGGVTVDLDPKASPIAPQSWGKFQNVPRKTLDSLSFAMKIGVGVEHFFPLTDPRRPTEPGTPGIVFDMRAGYLAHFADGAWITKDGDSTYVVEGAPVANIGGFFMQMALGIGFAKERR